VRTAYSENPGQPAAWAVINTQPHREHIALEHLERQDFSAYCPVIRRQRSHGRRVTEVLRPLFPSYLFVRVFPFTQRWRPMMSTIGVRSVVRCGDAPSLVDNGFVQSLKAREVDGVISRPETPYEVGQQIVLSGGAFDGLVATIIEMHERDRLTVLMDLLNRPIKVTIDESQIAPV
jgi:transcriptional antiterminator RfaH